MQEVAGWPARRAERDDVIGGCKQPMHPGLLATANHVIPSCRPLAGANPSVFS